MTIKKMKIYLATDIDKEADWLTDMSNKGFHFLSINIFFIILRKIKINLIFIKMIFKKKMRNISNYMKMLDGNTSYLIGISIITSELKKIKRVIKKYTQILNH